ncbi:hypothetical protein QAD02_018787 [Eretmocerus hayati]|uniref:Uncharacterized protein n=1 Tax=Eretmocerus hayati TaxID=131215 RepID=A0ACC2PMI4_9HYME|nr:hypothetical protein QAD02_018787 [Eretmocerus hayati]
MATPGKIRKLDEVVINRIAAGEIIQRPANALKELIENCLDAKATNIQITAKDGGLKLLQIQDNGTGIRKEDLDIVCERFTTSKLQNFDDLQTITTYGFRGEALASISHVAHLTITTKTAGEKCAYRVSYVDGKPKGPPTPCAGNQGTVILVENLFYNVSTRRKALSSNAEEFSKINDVVTKYAIHNPSIGFTLKKHGETVTHVRTPHSSTVINNVRLLYGNEVARELLEISLDDTSYKFKLNALITNPNYANKRFTFLLFINHRLVDSTLIKRTIEDMYAVYLPKKAHPWCYLSLEIDPHNVDVNVHPTKYEVRFCHEDMIIEKIKAALDEKLAASDASRTFYIQAKLPKMDITREDLQKVLPNTQNETDKSKSKIIYPHAMVRTDSSDQKLDKFNFTRESSKDKTKAIEMEDDDACNKIDKKTSNQINENLTTDVTANLSTDEVKIPQVSEPGTSNQSDLVIKLPNESTAGSDKKIKEKIHKPNSDERSPIEFKSYSVNEIQVETKLLSVLTLRKAVEDKYHEGLRKIISNLTFVGCVDESFALIQSGTSLYLCNTQKLAEELFYEIMLYDFANYGVIKFSEPLPIHELAMLGLECKEAGWSQEHGDRAELAMSVQELLLEKADMLSQYFSIYIDKNGCLKSLPILLENYLPSQSAIPLFILRLSTEVNWKKEQPCFRDICRETAMLYSQVDITNDSWKHVTEHILYSAIKESLLPPEDFLHDSTILEIASLPELYKVFERC